jgi:hypothetical protein
MADMVCAQVFFPGKWGETDFASDCTLKQNHAKVVLNQFQTAIVGSARVLGYEDIVEA